jgi:hypothetical protein
MKKSIRMAPVIALLFVAAFPLSCGPGPSTKPARPGHPPVSQSAATPNAIRDLLKPYGLGLLPGSEVIDHKIRKNTIQIPDTGRSYETEVLSVWLSVPDRSLESIRDFYIGLAPHVITEQKANEETLMLQLSSVEDLKKAALARQSPVFLINIRKVRLNPVEKAAYAKEAENLQKRDRRDAVQEKRLSQLLNLLKEPYMVQVNVQTAGGLT